MLRLKKLFSLAIVAALLLALVPVGTASAANPFTTYFGKGVNVGTLRVGVNWKDDPVMANAVDPLGLTGKYVVVSFLNNKKTSATAANGVAAYDYDSQMTFNFDSKNVTAADITVALDPSVYKANTGASTFFSATLAPGQTEFTTDFNALLTGTTKFGDYSTLDVSNFDFFASVDGFNYDVVACTATGLTIPSRWLSSLGSIEVRAYYNAKAYKGTDGADKYAYYKLDLKVGAGSDLLTINFDPFLNGVVPATGALSADGNVYQAAQVTYSRSGSTTSVNVGKPANLTVPLQIGFIPYYYTLSSSGTKTETFVTANGNFASATTPSGASALGVSPPTFTNPTVALPLMVNDDCFIPSVYTSSYKGKLQATGASYLLYTRPAYPSANYNNYTDEYKLTAVLNYNGYNQSKNYTGTINIKYGTGGGGGSTTTTDPNASYMRLSPAPSNMNPGTTMSTSAVIYNSGGTSVSYSYGSDYLHLTSSNPYVVSVNNSTGSGSNSGTLYANQQGSATIYAWIGDYNSTYDSGYKFRYSYGVTVGTPVYTYTPPPVYVTPVPTPVAQTGSNSVVPSGARYGYSKGSSVNIRSGPSTSNSKVGKMNKGDSFVILSTEGSFYMIRFGNGTAYVSNGYSETYTTGENATRGYTTRKCNMLNAASTSGKSLGSQTKGSDVIIVGESGSYYKCVYRGGFGYILKSNVALYNN